MQSNYFRSLKLKSKGWILKLIQKLLLKNILNCVSPFEKSSDLVRCTIFNLRSIPTSNNVATNKVYTNLVNFVMCWLHVFNLFSNTLITDKLIPLRYKCFEACKVSQSTSGITNFRKRFYTIHLKNKKVLILKSSSNWNI